MIEAKPASLPSNNKQVESHEPSSARRPGAAKPMRRCFCRGRSIFTRPPAVGDPLGASGGAVTDRCHRPLVPCYLPLVSTGAIRRPPHAPLAYAYAGAHVEELLSLRRAPFQLQRGKKQYFASDFTRHAAPDAGAADACRCG